MANIYIYGVVSMYIYGVVTIAQLVEMTDSAVLGSVVKVVNSIPAVGHKKKINNIWGCLDIYGVVSIAQLVEMTDSAVLGSVVEVVSSIPAVGHKIFFSIFRHS